MLASDAGNALMLHLGLCTQRRRRLGAAPERQGYCGGQFLHSVAGQDSIFSVTLTLDVVEGACGDWSPLSQSTQQVGDGPTVCHTGHAFSLRSLAAVQQEATENALWSAVRALQEKEVLQRKIAALECSAGDDARAARAEAEAEALSKQIEALRQLVKQG